MYLIDTNILSTGAPSKSGNPEIVEWMDANSAKLYLSAVTIAEVEDGIAKLRREGASRRAANLAAWLGTLLHLYGERVLAFDTGVARVAGALLDKARGAGVTPGLADVIIAGTALHHDLTLLTHNTRDFAPLGTKVHDPFVSLPR